jgi:hypothetical protein
VLQRRRVFLRLAGSHGSHDTRCVRRSAPGGEPNVYRVGWLSGITKTKTAAQIDAFRTSMHDFGCVESENLTVDTHYAGG